jgi:uncharacterized protein
MFAAKITPLGVEHDREIVIVKNGRIADARRYSKLLGLHGGLDAKDRPNVDGHPWDSPEARELASQAVGTEVELIQFDGPERFDVLPLLVATDGAIAALGEDGRRLRPNIVIGDVEGLAERQWAGRRIQIGDVIIEFAQLRQRCVMTTYDPDTQVQDINVLKRIVSEFDGKMALDTRVITPGEIRIGDVVRLVE